MNGTIVGFLVLGGIGFCFSLTLAFLSKKLKVEENPLVEEILKVLPGINCGACGFSGCKAFAEAIVEGKDVLTCIPGGEEVNKKISAILGREEEKVLKKKAVVKCQAKNNQKKSSFLYQGPTSCYSANILGGNIDCPYGCLGFGDCVKVCPVGAISIEEGRACIDIEKCIGCGKCVKACPRNLIQLVPVKDDIGVWYVACNNKDKAISVRNVCSVGCIGCGICTRVENSPFVMENNLSSINYEVIEDIEPLEKAKLKCPTKCINSLK